MLLCFIPGLVGSSFFSLSIFFFYRWLVFVPSFTVFFCHVLSITMAAEAGGWYIIDDEMHCKIIKKDVGCKPMSRIPKSSIHAGSFRGFNWCALCLLVRIPILVRSHWHIEVTVISGNFHVSIQPLRLTKYELEMRWYFYGEKR